MVTVILNGYKRFKHFEEQLKAIKGQTLRPKEILLWQNKGEDFDDELVKQTTHANCNKNFGVWLDGGIRNGQDIFTAYTQGAEFVGIGRPIIYACVLYGEPGVSSITKKMAFELESQCRICGQNDLNDYEKLKENVITDK